MVNHEEDSLASSTDDTRREYFRPIVADLQNSMEKIGFNYRCDICWDKHQVVGRATAWGSYKSCSNPIIRRRHEYILVWNKGPWRLDPPSEGIKSDLTDEEFQQWSMSYWPIQPETQNRGGHEVPFPERLARRVIKMFCYPTDVVVDPFSGTGTTCLAAHLLKRQYIGVDNDFKFVEYARNRIDKHTDMFDDTYFSGINQYA
jgi:site-specific DNA-methyltransferase (adenine-specific)